MPELGSFGSVRGVPGNGHSYREPRRVRVIQSPCSGQSRMTAPRRLQSYVLSNSFIKL